MQSMDIFETLKKSIRVSIGKLQRDPSLAEIIQAVNACGDWNVLENRLYELRTISRKRQQEILDRLEPLAERVEDIVAAAKKAKFKVKRQSMLRQADDLMRELESEEEPAKLYSANGQMLTKLIMQVRRARAMSDRGIDSETIDQVATNLDSIAVQYQDVLDATADCDAAVELGSELTPPNASEMEQRLQRLYQNVADDDSPCIEDEKMDTQLQSIEQRLYEPKPDSSVAVERA